MSQDLVVQALTALRQKNFATARDCIASYSEENSLELQHYLIKGLSEIALTDWNAARDTFLEAVEVFPHQPQLWLNLGVAQENLGTMDDAADSYRHSLDLKPDQADACGNLSNIYCKQGRFAEAESMAHRAYELGAPKAQAMNSLGLALAKQGKFDAAGKIFAEARQLDPANPMILANLANLAVDQLKMDSAWPLFAAARITDDNASTRRDEGMARLLAGDYAAGWNLYESRLELPRALRLRPACPRWNGEPLTGKKLLLIAEQGFGDTIQFCRYGHMLDASAMPIWMVPKPLESLLKDNLPGLVLAEQEPMPDADYWLPLMSFPHALGKPAFADAPAPYLRASVMGPQLPDPKKPARKIGLVWTASPTNDRDYEKSMHIDDLAPLWTMKDTQFYAPFVNPRIAQQLTDQPIQRLDHLITDFSDTASLLTQFDCVISVCTSVAHLAGALGVKTYTLLPWCADWRWGISGEATPWYGSMTLLRQPKYGDWGSVVRQLMEKLA